MSRNLVSVIVPNYCHAKYLDQRIKSIIDQTYHNFELIILDDCSPDNGASKAVIEKYRDNPHVSQIVYNEQNSGSTFKQWDKGINLAKGELIWIAESDDFCEPNLLEMLIAEFERNPKLTLAYSLTRRVNADGQPIKYLCYTPSGVTRLDGKDYVRRYMAMGNHCKNASACLFKKSAYMKIDKMFTTYKAGGDMLFWIEIAELGNVAIINKRLNYFRQHSQKVTPESSRKGINSIEYKKTFEYVLSNFDVSKRRKSLMTQYYRYTIKYRKYESGSIREDVFKYLNLKPLPLLECFNIKILLALRNRFSIFV